MCRFSIAGFLVFSGFLGVIVAEGIAVLKDTRTDTVPLRSVPTFGSYIRTDAPHPRLTDRI